MTGSLSRRSNQNVVAERWSSSMRVLITSASWLRKKSALKRIMRWYKRMVASRIRRSR